MLTSMTSTEGQEPAMKYRIADSDGRSVDFDGVLLATENSRRQGIPRWTETNLWKTVGGNYILQKVGKSSVFHRAEGGCDAGVEIESSELPMDATPCDRCQPSLTSFVRHEVDRSTVHVSTTPEGVVESAYHADDDGVLVLTWTNRRLLVAASKVDPQLKEAFSVQRIE
jgi:hypothetical protein